MLSGQICFCESALVASDPFDKLVIWNKNEEFFMDSNGAKYFQAFIAQSAAYRLSKYTKLNFEVHPGAVLSVIQRNSEEIAVIMVWGSVGAVNFKIHYDYAQAAAACASCLGRTKDSLAPKTVREFMRELCNLTAGFLRTFMQKNQVPMGMSLPFLAEGDDELIFQKLLDPRADLTAWRLKAGSVSFLCSSEILVLEESMLAGLKSEFESAVEQMKTGSLPDDDDGEVNFL